VNGEGVDVTIVTGRGDTRFGFTFGEWNCLKVLMERVDV